MNWFKNLVNKALKDDYLDELIIKAEILYTYTFLSYTSNNIEKPFYLSEKEFVDIVKFADILCRSELSIARNKAYKIISLIYDSYREDKFFLQCADIVLTKLGIFPTLGLIENQSDISSIENVLEKVVKEVYQESPFGGKTFTDAQYRLFERLKNSNHFSFSGPTSFGKSFVMEAFIHHIIQERHGIDNIVILVPTRALINQVSKKLKSEIKTQKYKVLTHPVVPGIFKSDNNKYVFVFTPERWISYLSNKDNPVVTYMFIDEAHKTVSINDTRSPLYYHAILQAERKSINLYFASPNIPNAEIFLQLFEKSSDETMVIEDVSVSQNRYFIDLIEKKAVLFSDTGKEISFYYDFSTEKGRLTKVLNRFGEGNQNIVYCNTVDDTIEFSMKYAKTRTLKEDKRITELISLVKSFVHKDYYLIDCLKYGVAFHFGRLPQRIRERVEQLFIDGVIDYVFCTSTLLEGVNLPAKNIFIFSNAIGLTKFKDIDFWNLAGRAGRLSKEMSGNIICVRAFDKVNRWKNPEIDLEIVRNKSIKPIEPTIIKGQGNFYKNIGNVIQNKPFTKAKPTENERVLWNQYSNILYVHQTSKSDSILMNTFLKKNAEAKKILDSVSKNNKIPVYILEQSTGIKPKYQNKLWASEEIEAFPSEVSTDSCEIILNILYDVYNWMDEESGGRNPMVKNKSRLKYFAVLMNSWISGYQLNMIIKNTLRYFQRRGFIYEYGQEIAFDKDDKSHINKVINDLMSDIDNVLRFKIKNYMLNYYLIYSEKTEDTNPPKWIDYIEYGTTESAVIALQTIGLPRHLSNFIIKHHDDCMVIEGNELMEINSDKLLSKIDRERFAQEFEEISEFLRNI
ncbi:DEAD/DEAH box helicase [Anaerotignum sp. MB30-C6]|uniref:DEAD/DEAH box helicase n=1 Tax=Anaerotignum sp. MB30-C6 TaxID=3070814 RepID=UPI0027DD2D69|nr:DEAD/DEAH box helicase [Anaerotignum sp. MB30-C6]WMI82114.1 DEAD/DEAH box helicase [Anaerotignum sp. MB30-C6]